MVHMNKTKKKSAMKNILKIEELTMFAFSIYVFNLLPYAWWVFPALLLTPDIGMLGYVANPRIGAWTYNFFHHKGVAILVGAVGLYAGLSFLMLAGIILFAHASFDRMLGYGLKYTDSFQHTHLGIIEKEKKVAA
jgi:hypothetical protein